MKLVIHHSNTKRVIDGGFDLCCSRADAEAVIACLRRALGTGDDPSTFSFGWIEVRDGLPAPGNVQPIAWDAQGVLK